MVDHARHEGYAVLDWMSSVAPEKLVASTGAEPRWTVTAASDQRSAAARGPRPGHPGVPRPRRGGASASCGSGSVGGGALSMTAAAP